jgi:hypothetical protein
MHELFAKCKKKKDYTYCHIGSLQNARFSCKMQNDKTMSECSHTAILAVREVWGKYFSYGSMGSMAVWKYGDRHRK